MFLSIPFQKKVSIESICEFYDLEFELLYCDEKSIFLLTKNPCNNNDVLFL